ncbi:MAG: YnbE family lipoprotein [Novosphingobium sp.]
MASIGNSGEAGGRLSRRHPIVGAGPAVLLAGVMALSACVSVTAPDKPIVIELNINIKQEVIYRLAADANATIESNRDIF